MEKQEPGNKRAIKWHPTWGIKLTGGNICYNLAQSEASNIGVIKKRL
jgi:hypothetical protein